jgi:hypothetical protein
VNVSIGKMIYFYYSPNSLYVSPDLVGDQSR